MHDVLQSALDFMRSLMHQNKLLSGTGDGCIEVRHDTEVDGRWCSMIVDFILQVPRSVVCQCLHPDKRHLNEVTFDIDI